MKGKGSNENKGYAFVTYRTKEMAAEAIKSLHNTELKVSIVLFKNIFSSINRESSLHSVLLRSLGCIHILLRLHFQFLWGFYWHPQFL